MKNALLQALFPQKSLINKVSRKYLRKIIITFSIHGYSYTGLVELIDNGFVVTKTGEPALDSLINRIVITETISHIFGHPGEWNDFLHLA